LNLPFRTFSAENNFHTQKLLVTKILYILSYSLLKDLNRFNKEQNSKIAKSVILLFYNRTIFYGKHEMKYKIISNWKSWKELRA